jgi:AcrR family transcriptional regulator
MNREAPSRAYNMDARRAAAEATRERILDAAADAFLSRWFDDVTIQSVAKDAGVSGQTVLNHFGSKESLIAAAAGRLTEQIESRRATARPGDVDAAIDALVHDYEITGDATIRALALEDRVESIRPLLRIGRASHRKWVEEKFGRPDLVPELVSATDVYTWKLLRRDQGLSRKATSRAVRRIVLALLALEPETEERNP